MMRDFSENITARDYHEAARQVSDVLNFTRREDGTLVAILAARRSVRIGEPEALAAAIENRLSSFATLGNFVAAKEAAAHAARVLKKLHAAIEKEATQCMQ